MLKRKESKQWKFTAMGLSNVTESFILLVRMTVQGPKDYIQGGKEF